MDSLSQLLEHLEVRADVFYNGSLCGLQGFNENTPAGMLHLVKSGCIQITTRAGHSVTLPASSLVFFPSGVSHSIRVMQSEEAHLVCATITLPVAQQNLLIETLPQFIFMRAQENAEIVATTELLFKEAFRELQGYKMMIDRLCDIFMAQLIRHVVDTGLVQFSLIAGASHPQLKPLVDKLKDAPHAQWSVESMAQEVAMSRSRFAQLFKETLGQAPMDYLTDLRLAAAKGLLKQSKPVGLIAHRVGYENASTLARVFKRRFGMTPRQWLKHQVLSFSKS